MTIAEDVINQIRERVNIVSFIGEYVQLKPAGRNYRGLCPFHSEKTPSFMVSPLKGIFHCFGCGAGGNVFNFLMKFKGIAFPDAVRFLGERVGVPIETTHGQAQRKSQQEVIYQANAEAARLFEKILYSEQGKQALDYLLNRNISRDALKEFRLGYAPESWDTLYAYLKSRGYTTDVLAESGLIVKKKSASGFYDRFRNRIIFPIQDTIGRFIGFGGRTLEKNADIPKYVNSSENLVYHKGRHLYGFVNAQEHIRKKDCAIVVEGYIDVVRMHQEGIKNAVAPLGTALTEDQIALILRHTKNIFLAFDADEAGIRAALRTISLIHSKGIDPSFIRLPSGRDPGDFFDHYSPSDFELLLKDSIPGIDFLISNHTAGKKEYTANEKIAILTRLNECIQVIEDDILKLEFLKKISEALDIREAVIERELERLNQKLPYRESRAPVKKKDPGLRNEIYLLLLILNNPGLFSLAKPRLDESHFKGKWSRFLWKAISRADEFKDWDSAAVFDYLHNEKFVEYLSGRLLENKLSVNSKEQLIDMIANLQERQIRRRLEDINVKLKSAELENDESAIERLVLEKQALTNDLGKVRNLRLSKTSLGSN